MYFSGTSPDVFLRYLSRCISQIPFQMHFSRTVPDIFLKCLSRCISQIQCQMYFLGILGFVFPHVFSNAGCKRRGPAGHFDFHIWKCNTRWCCLRWTPSGLETFHGTYTNSILCFDTHFHPMNLYDFWKDHWRWSGERCFLLILIFSLDLILNKDKA